MIAINDAFFLETSIYRLLRTHFRSRDYYVQLFDLFQEVITSSWIHGVALNCLLDDGANSARPIPRPTHRSRGFGGSFQVLLRKVSA